MIEDELWLVFGIFLLFLIGILLYLAVTNPKFTDILKNLIWNLKLPKP